MQKARNTYEIIFYDILRIPELYHKRILHNDSSAPDDVPFSQDISNIVNDIDNSIDWSKHVLRELRETVQDNLQKYGADIENSRVNIFNNAGDIENSLQKNFLRPVFSALDPKDKRVEQILTHKETSISQLEQSCKDRFDPQRFKKNKKKLIYPPYLQNRSFIPVTKGFVQRFDLTSRKESIVSKHTPKNLKQLATLGRTKYFASDVEKEIRKTAEYITKELHYTEEDKSKLKSMDKEVIKNDLIGFKGIFADPSFTNTKIKTNAFRSALKKYCNRHGLTYEEKYKAISAYGYDEVQNIENADVIYIDGKGNRLYEFEAQITDSLRYTIIEIAGERSHNLNRERMQNGLTEDFFKGECIDKLLEEWKQSNETQAKKGNIEAKKEEMRSTYNRVYNLLKERFQYFMKNVREEYGTSTNSSLPPFLQFDENNYFADLPKK